MRTINGKPLEVEIHGDGEALLMIHGLGGTANVWGAQTSSLSRFFKVIRPELEGSGRSPCQGHPSITSFTEDLLALLDDLKIEAAHMVGHSMGTIICQRLAARHPARVQSMVLLGPLVAPSDPARSAIRDRAARVRAGGMGEVADALVLAGTSAATRAARPEIAAFVRELLLRQTPENYARTCEALAAAQAADLSAITCRTLLISGDEDAVGPPAAIKQMAASIAGARALILPHCGHWTPLEKPEEVTAAMLGFYFG